MVIGRRKVVNERRTPHFLTGSYLPLRAGIGREDLITEWIGVIICPSDGLVIAQGR